MIDFRSLDVLSSRVQGAVVVVSIDRGCGLDFEVWSLGCGVCVFNLCSRWLPSADCSLFAKSKDVVSRR